MNDEVKSLGEEVIWEDDLFKVTQQLLSSEDGVWCEFHIYHKEGYIVESHQTVGDAIEAIFKLRRS